MFIKWKWPTLACTALAALGPEVALCRTDTSQELQDPNASESFAEELGRGLHDTSPGFNSDGSITSGMTDVYLLDKTSRDTHTNHATHSPTSVKFFHLFLQPPDISIDPSYCERYSNAQFNRYTECFGGLPELGLSDSPYQDSIVAVLQEDTNINMWRYMITFKSGVSDRTLLGTLHFWFVTVQDGCESSTCGSSDPGRHAQFYRVEVHDPCIQANTFIDMNLVDIPTPFYFDGPSTTLDLFANQEWHLKFTDPSGYVTDTNLEVDGRCGDSTPSITTTLQAPFANSVDNGDGSVTPLLSEWQAALGNFPRQITAQIHLEYTMSTGEVQGKIGTFSLTVSCKHRNVQLNPAYTWNNQIDLVVSVAQSISPQIIIPSDTFVVLPDQNGVTCPFSSEQKLDYDLNFSDDGLETIVSLPLLNSITLEPYTDGGPTGHFSVQVQQVMADGEVVAQKKIDFFLDPPEAKQAGSTIAINFSPNPDASPPPPVNFDAVMGQTNNMDFIAVMDQTNNMDAQYLVTYQPEMFDIEYYWASSDQIINLWDDGSGQQTNFLSSGYYGDLQNISDQLQWSHSADFSPHYDFETFGMTHQCNPWTVARARIIASFAPIYVRSANYPNFTTELTFQCVFRPCSNAQRVIDTGEALLVHRVNQSEALRHQVSIDPALTIQVESIFNWCEFPLILQLEEVTHLDAQGQSHSVELADLVDFGISQDLQNNSLIVYNRNQAHINSTLTLKVRRSVGDYEQDWYDFSLFSIDFVQPSCQVTLSEILTYFGQPEIAIEREVLDEAVFINLEPLIAKARQAFRDSQIHYCGGMLYRLERQSESTSQVVTLLEDQVTLQVQSSTYEVTGLNQDFKLLFYFDENPDRQVVVPIEVTVNPCDPKAVELKPETLELEYTLGELQKNVDLGTIIAEKYCGRRPVLEEVRVSVQLIPNGYSLSDLVTVNAKTNTVSVLQVDDLNLRGAQVQFNVDAVVDSYPVKTYFSVKYEAKVGFFQQAEDRYLAPKLTKETAQSTWAFQLPPVVGNSQQLVTVTLVPPEDTPNIFDFYPESNKVLLKPSVVALIESGRLCLKPQFLPVTLHIDTSVMGEGQTTSFVEAEIECTEVLQKENSYSFDWMLTEYISETEAEAEEGQGLVLEISQIDRAGQVKVSSSDDLKVLEDLEWLKREVQLGGLARQAIQLTVDPVEEQSQADLTFTWSALNFTQVEITLQLHFEKPQEVSRGGYPNSLQITIWDSSLFARTSDGLQITSGTSLLAELPKMAQEPFSSVESLAELVDQAGRAGLMTAFLFRFFSQFGMNQVLSQVRNLQIITHHMMLSVEYPQTSQSFFQGIFDFASFDLVPTDGLYDYLFDFENEAFNEQAEALGYPSRFLIVNSGSVSLFMVLMVVSQLFYGLLGLLAPKGGKTEGFAKKKGAEFRWAGLTEFVNETYLSLVFCVAINTPVVCFDSFSDSFNSVFVILVGTLIVFWPLFITFKAHQFIQNRNTQGNQESSNTRQDLKEGGSADKAQPPLSNAPQEAPGHQQEARGEEGDAEEAEARFGEVVGQIASNRHVSSQVALVYVVFQFYRRGMLGALIMGLEQMPTYQLIAVLHLNLAFCLYIAAWPVVGPTQSTELVNEIILLLNIYVIMVLANDSRDALQDEKLGLLMVILAVSNLFLNLAFVAAGVLHRLKLRLRRCLNRRRAKRMNLGVTKVTEVSRADRYSYDPTATPVDDLPEQPSGLREAEQKLEQQLEEAKRQAEGPQVHQSDQGRALDTMFNAGLAQPQNQPLRLKRISSTRQGPVDNKKRVDQAIQNFASQIGAEDGSQTVLKIANHENSGFRLLDTKQKPPSPKSQEDQILNYHTRLEDWKKACERRLESQIEGITKRIIALKVEMSSPTYIFRAQHEIVSVQILEQRRAHRAGALERLEIELRFKPAGLSRGMFQVWCEDFAKKYEMDMPPKLPDFYA